MSDFRKLRLTEGGRQLLALAHQGVQLQLLNIVVGNGEWATENQEGDPPADLVNQKRAVSITSIQQSGEVALVRGMLTNSGLTQGFSITEIGVTALHPDDGEILYMADYCELAKSSYIPDNSGAPVEIPLALNVLVSSSQQVTLTIEDRFFSATKQDISDHNADRNAHDPLVERLHVSTPSITAPAAGATNVIGMPTLQSSPFETHFSGVVHAQSQWQVDRATGDFSAPLHDSGATASALTSYTLPGGLLAVSTAYKARVRHKCAPDGLWSPWSAAVLFTTRAVFTYVAAPTNSSPSDGATNIGETPTLQASAFAVVGGSDTHMESEFRILRAGVVVHTSTGLGAVTSYSVPAGVLTVGTAHTWQCRYHGTSLGWSDWSTPTAFETMSAFIVGDDAVLFDEAAEDWPFSADISFSSGIESTADGAEAFSAGEDQGGAEADWARASIQGKVRAPEALGVGAGSTVTTLQLTSAKSGLLSDGDAILVNNGSGGAALTRVVCGTVSVSGSGPYTYTCSNLSPALTAVPDKVVLPVDLYVGYNNGSRQVRPDSKMPLAAATCLLEDVRGGITQLVMDTTTSGHFNAAASARVIAGCRVLVEGGTALGIRALSGDGTSAGSVQFGSALATGTYTVTGIYGLRVVSGLGLTLSSAAGAKNQAVGNISTTSASGTTDGAVARAFDARAATDNANLSNITSDSPYWYLYRELASAWIQVQLTEARVVRAFSIHSQQGYTEAYPKYAAPRNFTLQASNNGTDWTDLHSVTDAAFDRTTKNLTYAFTNATAYSYYRLYLTESWMNISGHRHYMVAELALWEEDPAGYATKLNLSAAGAVFSNNMTGVSNSEAWHDGVTSKTAALSTSAAAPSAAVRELKIDWGAGASRRIVRAKLYGPSDQNIWKGGDGSGYLAFQGSTDGSTWVTLATSSWGTSAAAAVLDFGYVGADNTAYRYHRFAMYCSDASSWQVATVELWEALVSPVSQYYTAVTDAAALGMAHVTDINSAAVMQTVGGTNDHAWYSISLDGGATYRVWTGSAWRDIASSLASVHGGADGTWHYRSNADVWTAAYASNAAAAISQAVAAGSNNQMTASVMAGIADADWPSVASVSEINLAVTLYTSSAANIPKVAAVEFNCDYAAGARGEFVPAPVASGSWTDDAGTTVLTQVSAEIEIQARRVAMGVDGLPSGAKFEDGQINLWKQGA